MRGVIISRKRSESESLVIRSASGFCYRSPTKETIWTTPRLRGRICAVRSN
jgi:hypothetical protein